MQQDPTIAFVKSARLAVLGLIAFTAPQHAAPASQIITLSWDSSLTDGDAGYRIYYGPMYGPDSNTITVGIVTNAAITGLVEGSSYCIAADACNATGLESELSNEVLYWAPDRAVLAIKNLQTKGSARVIDITANGTISDRWLLKSSPDLKRGATTTQETNSSVNVSVAVTGMPKAVHSTESAVVLALNGNAALKVANHPVY